MLAADEKISVVLFLMCELSGVVVIGVVGAGICFARDYCAPTQAGEKHSTVARLPTL